MWCNDLYKISNKKFNLDKENLNDFRNNNNNNKPILNNQTKKQTNKILYNVKPCYVSTKNDIVLVNPSSYMFATNFFQTISFSHFVEFLMEEKISTLAFDHYVYIKVCYKC